jgi:leucine-zipper of insertion element IS481
VARWRAEGESGLRDRSSRPHRLRRPTPAAVAGRLGDLRRQRWSSKAIAVELGVSSAIVSRILKRLGLSRLRDLEPAAPVRRYQRERPGELIHIDIKKLGRFEAVGHRITGDRWQGCSPGEEGERCAALPGRTMSKYIFRYRSWPFRVVPTSFLEAG